MNVLHEARTVLEKQGFGVTPSDSIDEILFEDNSLLGFVWAAQTVKTLLRDWQSRQDNFLRRSSRSLGASGLKAWNLYAVLLTQDIASGDQRPQLLLVEEDFRGARKIARSDLLMPEHVLRALYPFVPIQHVATVQREDLLKRFADQVSGLPKRAVDTILKADPSRDNVQILLEAHEAH